jgi:tocopherol cyclase
MTRTNWWHRWQVKWTPEAFQGWGKTRRYFEGWYVKLISPDEGTAIAVIPGIAYDEQGEGQAFIQVLDGRKNTSEYHRFETHQFRPSPKTFDLQLGENSFSSKGMNLNLPGLQASLTFESQVPWPVKPLSPGIMGWYAFVPFMECYHGILSMDTDLRGQLHLQGADIDMNGGKAYLEKDWGRSFPSSWIWMQSNHFEIPGISFKASVARIPWIGNAFVGFIAGLWLNGQLIRFTTYTGARLVKTEVQDGRVFIVLEDSKHRLEIEAIRSDGGDLVSPIQGLMAGRVNETMSARIKLRLADRKGKLLFEGEGRNAGLEVAGPYQELLTP